MSVVNLALTNFRCLYNLKSPGTTPLHPFCVVPMDDSLIKIQALDIISFHVAKFFLHCVYKDVVPTTDKAMKHLRTEIRSYIQARPKEKISIHLRNLYDF